MSGKDVPWGAVADVPARPMAGRMCSAQKHTIGYYLQLPTAFVDRGGRAHGQCTSEAGDRAAVTLSAKKHTTKVTFGRTQK